MERCEKRVPERFRNLLSGVNSPTLDSLTLNIPGGAIENFLKKFTGKI